MRRTLSLLVCALACTAIAAVGCTADRSADPSGDDGERSDPLAAFAGEEGTIRIAGGTAHLDIMNEAASRIRAYNPAIDFVVDGGHSAIGVQKVGTGVVDIGNTGRLLTAEEASTYPDVVSFEFARDAIVIVVSPENPVSDISADDLKRVFTGRITNWQDLGGADRLIRVYSYDDASGTHEVFQTIALGSEEIISSAIRVATMADMRRQIPRDPAGIGYTGLAETCEECKVIALDGVEPTEDKIVSGAYWLTRCLCMNTLGEPQGIVKAFVDYVMGEDMKDAIREDGYIPMDAPADQ